MTYHLPWNIENIFKHSQCSNGFMKVFLLQSCSVTSSEVYTLWSIWTICWEYGMHTHPWEGIFLFYIYSTLIFLINQVWKYLKLHHLLSTQCQNTSINFCIISIYKIITLLENNIWGGGRGNENFRGTNIFHSVKTYFQKCSISTITQPLTQKSDLSL